MGDESTGGRKHKVNPKCLGGFGLWNRCHAIVSKDDQRTNVSCFDRSSSFRQVQSTHVN